MAQVCLAATFSSEEYLEADKKRKKELREQAEAAGGALALGVPEAELFAIFQARRGLSNGRGGSLSSFEAA